MAKKLDKIVIIDLEATCWNGPTPQEMVNEIIEIGVCLLDVHTGEITDNRGIIVKPERSVVSEFCTELTTITPELVEKEGISLQAAFQILKKEYETPSRAWASFGAYDMNQIRRQCTDLGIGYPMGPSHINVKTLFALKNKLGHVLGMDGALKFLNIPLEGTHHRGIDDANNIAKILWKVLYS